MFAWTSGQTTTIAGFVGKLARPPKSAKKKSVFQSAVWVKVSAKATGMGMAVWPFPTVLTSRQIPIIVGSVGQTAQKAPLSAKRAFVGPLPNTVRTG